MKTRQLDLFPEQGRRGGVDYSTDPVGPVEGDTLVGIAFGFSAVGSHTIVSFATEERGDIKAIVEASQVPTGLGMGDRCTLRFSRLLRSGLRSMQFGWRLQSVDSGMLAGGDP
jgi:hypothetical protein